MQLERKESSKVVRRRSDQSLKIMSRILWPHSTLGSHSSAKLILLLAFILLSLHFTLTNFTSSQATLITAWNVSGQISKASNHTLKLILWTLKTRGQNLHPSWTSESSTTVQAPPLLIPSKTYSPFNCTSPTANHPNFSPTLVYAQLYELLLTAPLSSSWL